MDSPSNITASEAGWPFVAVWRSSRSPLDSSLTLEAAAAAASEEEEVTTMPESADEVEVVDEADEEEQ